MTDIQFINHASVLVNFNEVALLSDPWYQGDAFHKGWNLVYELNDEQIVEVLNNITHIWISHEHPDHFSILFFKKFGDLLKEKKIKIIFQETKDKRVETFLSKSGFNVQIIKFNQWIKLGDDFEILCFKDGFYDSGLAIKTADKKILNLNDCEIKDDYRCKEVLKLTGECDVLISQFSYAAWKGGKDNFAWRKLAAEEKINTLKLQASYFNPKVLIPFASYVYFSNTLNFYLNDASNKPGDVIEAFKNSSVKVNVLKPFQKISDLGDDFDNRESLEFWNNEYKKAMISPPKEFLNIDITQIEESFLTYKERIFKNNSKWFMRLMRLISPLSVFKPIIIKISDLNLKVELDIFSDQLKTTNTNPHISMSSESLDFILKNTFGFDTLTVNGCFEEETKSGFSIATRSLAVENLNNMGIKFVPSIIFNFQLIKLFLSRLYAVTKKINLANN